MTYYVSGGTLNPTNLLRKLPAFIYYTYMFHKNGPHISGRFLKQKQWGTLASQAEIGVWVQAPGDVLRGPGVHHWKKFETVCKILQSSAFLAGKRYAMPSIMLSLTL